MLYARKRRTATLVAVDSDTAAWVAAAISGLGAGASTWQATLARKQARYASRSANAAEVTAVDTQRTADAAEKQFTHSEAIWKEAKQASRVSALRAMVEAIHAFVTTIWSLSVRLGDASEPLGGRELAERQTRLMDARVQVKTSCAAVIEFLPRDSGSVDPAARTATQILAHMKVFETEFQQVLQTSSRTDMQVWLREYALESVR